MEFPKAKAVPLDAPEVVLNLWAYANGDGYILRLAGRAYVLCGTEREKLDELHRLSRSDFLAAKWMAVPPNFKMVDDGRKLSGVAHASHIRDLHAMLFGPLMDELNQTLPEQVRTIEGEYEKFRLSLSKDPLCVMTIVIEHEDGSLVPMVRSEATSPRRAGQ